MFSNNEYADMHLILGECRNNANAAAVLYRERYPLRRQPSSNTFRRLDQRIRETGRVDPAGPFYRDRGRPRTLRTPEVEEAVLDLVDQNPTTSTRIISNMLENSQSLVGRIIKDERLHPFHYTKVQALLPTDLPRRENFCNWLLEQIQQEPNFSRKILWTDEANFSRDGFFNTRNSHYYALENPHVIRPSHYQHRFSVNVWAGIIGNRLIGPVIVWQGNIFWNF
nr:PREDICTED: uncharacterized protein LOC107399187 [Tribolium castaneum]|eukprot:XP_015840428.1 PREDICTED: uncharacterized protein LOC107399187 [Tribolium castaneum]